MLDIGGIEDIIKVQDVTDFERVRLIMNKCDIIQTKSRTEN